MKICFLAHNLRNDNGGGVFSGHVISGIIKAEHASAEILTTEKSSFAGEYPVLDFGRIAFFKTFFCVRRIVKECDVIHAFDLFPYGMLAVFASIGLRKKIIITLIGSGSILPLYAPAVFFFARVALRRANKIVAISRFTRDEILKKVPGLAIEVIHPGIDLEEYMRTTFPDKNVRALQPYILSVGTIRWRKGYKQSLRAFAEISHRFPEYRYVIVGKKHSEKFFGELQQIVKTLDLEQRVIFLTDVETRTELLGLFKGAELFCLFSENMHHDIEGFGIVFLEAAACGLPVVGMKHCGVEDAVEDGKNGILVGVRDPHEFAEAVTTILKDSGVRDAMKKESLAWVQRFAWEKKNEEYGQVYRDLS